MSAHQPGKRTSLRHQAFRRIALVMVISMLGICMIGLNAFFTMRQRQVQEAQATLQNYYAQLLPRAEAQWQTEASRTRTRIEMTRMLEARNVRWDELSALLNAQWEFISFSNIIILGPEGKIRYRYGTEAHDIAQNAMDSLGRWHLSGDGARLYRAYALPIWLGQQGRGHIWLLRNVDTAALNTLAVPNTQLCLRLDDRDVVTSVQPEDWPRANEPIPVLEKFDTQTAHLSLPWPDADTSRVTLRIEQRITSNFPMVEFLRRPVMLLLLITFLLWLGLGRWLKRTVARVEALQHATEHYSASNASHEARPILERAASRSDEIGDLAHALDAMMRDIEQRGHEQKAYLETLALLEEAVLELDTSGHILHASPGWHALSHGTRGPRATLFEFIHADDAESVRAQFDAFLLGEKEQALLRMRLAASAPEQGIWVEARFVRHLNTVSGMTTVRGILRDITQVYLHEKQITHMALHDVLTGLPNRVLLEDRLKIALRLARRTAHKVGVCFIDLDHFKHVNDTLGHKIGDKLLVEFARSLEQHLRDGDTLARWGGDEFVLLLPDMENQQAVMQVADKVRSIAQLPLQVDDTALSVTFSMGVALFPDDGADVDTLLAQADRTMFYAKAQGRNQIALFSDIAHKGSEREHLYIQNKLAAAIRDGRITAWFQPIVEAHSHNLIGAEALARWHDEELGWISPTTFIPMAENMGMICELGSLVWHSTLRAARDCARHDLRLAVNVSMRQLFTAGYTDGIIADTHAYGVSPDRIILEITETLASSDVEHTVQRLRALKQAGFHIAIDDFGTGYSSLSQLHDLQVDELKIDMSFVRRIEEPSGRSVIQAIIQLARALELRTVAEGVEDEATATQLRAMGATYLQGYHFGKPMPIEEFIQVCALERGNKPEAG